MVEEKRSELEILLGGFHNSHLEESSSRVLRGNTYRDTSTIWVIPSRGVIPCKVVSSIVSIIKPMNQKFFGPLFVENMEVGDAYQRAMELILGNRDLSQWKYIFTSEEDNILPQDTLLKLLESMDQYDAVSGLYWTKGEGGQPMCYDEETEVLTKDGWKLFSQASIKDELATRSKEGVLEFHRPSAKQEFFYSGPLICWAGRGIDIRVTPEHNLYCRTRCGDFRHLIASEAEKHIRIEWKRDALWKGKEEKYFSLNHQLIKMDDWLEFLGYYISEGCYMLRGRKKNRKTIDVRQCPGVTHDKIADVIRRIGWVSWTGKDRIQIRNNDLFDLLQPLGKSSDKYVPRHVFELSQRQIRIFLKALWDGDGSYRRGTQEGRFENYHTISKQLANDMQELLLRIGLAGTISKRESRSSRKDHPSYRVSVTYRDLTPRTTKRPFRIDYTGFVYDFTVPNHTLFIRRNGKVMWSGNCYGNPTISPKNFVPQPPPIDCVKEYNGLGMGCCLMKLDMFKKVPPPWFKTVQSPTEGMGTQDLFWFAKAGQYGYRFAVDGRVRVGHLDVATGLVW